LIDTSSTPPPPAKYCRVLSEAAKKGISDMHWYIQGGAVTFRSGEGRQC
jgi:hypothetical protein